MSKIALIESAILAINTQRRESRPDLLRSDIRRYIYAIEINAEQNMDIEVAMIVVLTSTRYCAEV
jgi:hypothetical protein